MKNYNFNIKNKILSIIMKNGEKKTSEKALIKSIKKLQKVSTIQSKEILQIAIISTLPTFKVHRIKNKKSRKKTVKLVPVFIKNKNSRISDAIKLILQSTSKHLDKNFSQKLKKELQLSAKNKSHAVNLKINSQLEVIKIKRLFRYYNW